MISKTRRDRMMQLMRMIDRLAWKEHQFHRRNRWTRAFHEATRAGWAGALRPCGRCTWVDDATGPIERLLQAIFGDPDARLGGRWRR